MINHKFLPYIISSPLDDFLLTDFINQDKEIFLTMNNNSSSVNIDVTIIQNIIFGYNLLNGKKYDELKQLIDKSEPLVNKCKENTYFIDLELLKSFLQFYTYNFHETVNLLKKIEFLIFESNSETYYWTIRKTVFLNLLAKSLQELGKFDNALNYANKGLDLAIKSNFNNKIYEFYILISKIYKYQGNLTLSLESALQSLSLANDLDDIPKKISSYIMLGGIEGLNRNLTKSTKYFNLSLILARKIHSDKINLCLNNLAMSYWLAGFLNESIEYLTESQKFVLKKNNLRQLSLLYNNLGLIYLSKGDYDNSEIFLLKALHLKEETNFVTRLGNTLLSLSDLYYHKKNFEKSEDYLLKSINLSKEKKDLNILTHSLFSLILLYNNIGNIPLVHKYYSEFSELLEDKTDDIYKLRYQLISGVISGNSSNYETLLNGLNNLETIIKMNSLDYEISIYAYFHFCLISFTIKSLFGIEMNYQKANDYLSLITSKALEYNNHETFWKCRILDAKFKTLANNIKDAEMILSSVIEETEIRGYNTLNKFAIESMNNIKSLNFAFDNEIGFNNSKKDSTRLENDIIQFISSISK